MRRRPLPVWKPSDDQMRHWPAVSGNSINGVGEKVRRRPSPIYWHPPEKIPHGALQKWFYERTGNADETLAEARRDRQRAIDEPLVPIAEQPSERNADEWTADVKRAAVESGADDVGITLLRAEYVFEGHEVPQYRWMVMIAVEHAYDALKAAPSMRTLVEVTRQYARGTRVAKGVANWLRRQGQDAFPYGGPMAGSFVLIPAAIEAGLGELGKHGSMIHRGFGSNFRLACVLTNAPWWQMVATTSEPPIFASTAASARTHARLTRFSRKRPSCAASDVGMSISTSACRISTRRKAARSASPSAHSAGRASGRISSENSRGACEAEIVNDRRILRAGRRATALMQKYHTRADSVHERAFAAPLGFCPLLFCAAQHISRNAATCRRMPSLGVSSLNSGRSSERPPFFDNPLCNVRKRTKKGGEGGFVRLFAHILCLQY